MFVRPGRALAVVVLVQFHFPGLLSGVGGVGLKWKLVRYAWLVGLIRHRGGGLTLLDHVSEWFLIVAVSHLATPPDACSSSQRRAFLHPRTYCRIATVGQR